MRFIIKHPLLVAFCVAIILNIIPFAVDAEEETLQINSGVLLSSHLEKDAKLSEEYDILDGLERWGYLDDDEREETLRRVAEFEMNSLGMEGEIYLSFEELESPTLGVYFDRDKIIKLDSFRVKERRMRDTLFTLLHEIYHAYQHYIVENLDFSDILVEKSRYYRQAREWKNNIEIGYISPDVNLSDYNSQPLERDADKYAEERVEEYLREIRKGV